MHRLIPCRWVKVSIEKVGAGRALRNEWGLSVGSIDLVLMLWWSSRLLILQYQFIG
jgi:hypothetical protein